MHHSHKSLFWSHLVVLLVFLCGFFYAGYLYYQFDLVDRARPMLDNLKTLNPQQLTAFSQNLETICEALSEVIGAILLMGSGCLFYAFFLFFQLIKICRSTERLGVKEGTEGVSSEK